MNQMMFLHSRETIGLEFKPVPTGRCFIRNPEYLNYIPTYRRDKRVKPAPHKGFWSFILESLKEPV